MTTPVAITREWSGETVAVLASGAGMTRDIADAVRDRCRVIAVNNQGLDLAPWADVLYAADAKWWEHYWEQASRFAGQKFTIRQTLRRAEVFSLEQSPERVFDSRPTHLASGGNSGYQALHLAVHFGASRVLLCGFDMRDVDGRRRRHDDYPKPLDTAGRFTHWLAAFDRLAPVLRTRGVDVVNCTPGSALRCFRFGSIEQELNEVRCA
jgi:hypothetical protein